MPDDNRPITATEIVAATVPIDRARFWWDLLEQVSDRIINPPLPTPPAPRYQQQIMRLGRYQQQIMGLGMSSIIIDDVSNCTSDNMHMSLLKEDPMAMSRKDFEVVAEALAEHRPDPKHGTVGEKRVWALIVRELAVKLEASCPGFNKEIFYKAAGYVGEGL